MTKRTTCLCRAEGRVKESKVHRVAMQAFKALNLSWDSNQPKVLETQYHKLLTTDRSCTKRSMMDI